MVLLVGVGVVLPVLLLQEPLLVLPHLLLVKVQGEGRVREGRGVRERDRRGVHCLDFNVRIVIFYSETEQPFQTVNRNPPAVAAFAAPRAAAGVTST